MLIINYYNLLIVTIKQLSRKLNNSAYILKTIFVIHPLIKYFNKQALNNFRNLNKKMQKNDLQFLCHEQYIIIYN